MNVLQYIQGFLKDFLHKSENIFLIFFKVHYRYPLIWTLKRPRGQLMDTFIDILYVNGLYAHQHEVFTIIRTLDSF